MSLDHRSILWYLGFWNYYLGCKRFFSHALRNRSDKEDSLINEVRTVVKTRRLAVTRTSLIPTNTHGCDSNSIKIILVTVIISTTNVFITVVSGWDKLRHYILESLVTLHAKKFIRNSTCVKMHEDRQWAETNNQDASDVSKLHERPEHVDKYRGQTK